jgi:hypothetical protein
MIIEFSNEALQEIERLAGLFYTQKQVATIMQISSTEMRLYMSDEEHPVYKAYMTGWYTAETTYREKVIRLANLGSSPAQSLVGKIIDHANMSQDE